MKKDSLFRRLFSVEALSGGLAGAALPYVLALAVKIAPTRVPVGVVAAGALLGWLLLHAINVRRRSIREERELADCQRQAEREREDCERQAEREREDCQRREIQEQLARIERVANTPPTRRGWLRWRGPHLRR